LWASELQDRRLLGDYSLREMSLEDAYVRLVGNKEESTNAR
jgi:hypothetical protein